MKRILYLLLLITGSVSAQSTYLNTGLKDSLVNPGQYTGKRLLIHGGGIIGDSISGTKVLFYGDSFTVGAGATSNAFRFTTLYSGKTGATELNKGISGTSLQERTSNDSSFYRRSIINIPTYNSTYRYIIIFYGVNDAQFGGGSVATFNTQYPIAISNVIAAGWPKNKIIILSPGFTNSTLNVSILPYVDATRAIAKTAGLNYIDVFNYIKSHGGSKLVSADSIHPNDLGHANIADAIIQGTTGNLKISGALSVNGQASANSFVAPTITSPRFIVPGGSNTEFLYGNGHKSDTVVVSKFITFKALSTAGNKFLPYDNGSTSTRMGIGFNVSPNVMTVFSQAGYPLLFGVGYDYSTLTTSTAGAYLSSSNIFTTPTIAGLTSLSGTSPLSISASTVTVPILSATTLTQGTNASSRNLYLGYDGGSTSSRFGMGLNTTGSLFSLFANSAYNICLGTGFDYSTITASNAGLVVDGSNNVVINKRLQLTAATTGMPSFRMPTGVRPTSPVEGDTYKDATNLYQYLNGAWSQISNQFLFTQTTAPDANYTITSPLQTVKLPVITANRNLGLPTGTAGQQLRIWNTNTSAFTHTITIGTLKDQNANTVSILSNSTWYNLESDGTNWNIVSISAPIRSTVVSSAGSLTLAYTTDYAFSGTSTTWTLPAISTVNTGSTYQITIKNRGTVNITLNSAAGGNDIYDSSAVSSITILPGNAVTLINDGTYFNRE